MSREGRSVATLLEAMPFIQSLWGKTIVVKYGGAAMVSRRLQEEFARDVVMLWLVGMEPIVVHGGGPQVTDMMARLGMDATFVHGHRITDEETMEVVRMVLVGKVNKDLIGLIHRQGGTAVGVSGEDGKLLVTERMTHVDDEGQNVDLGLVGNIHTVNPKVLELLRGGVIPVVASIGADESGQCFNVNADTAAGALAAALGAERLVLLTDVPGIMAPGSGDEGERLVDACSAPDITELEASGAVSGGMIPKLAAVRTALAAGVRSAHIIDGRVDHALLLAMLTEEGCGTTIS